MKLRSVVLAVALLLPSIVAAGPITTGTWSKVGGPAGSDSSSLGVTTTPFWAGNSWDGPNLNVGDLLEPQSRCVDCSLEYLNDGSGNYTPFRFTDEIFGVSKIFGITAWKNGTLSLSGDTFVYNNGAGNIYNSWDDPGQFALFRATQGSFRTVETDPIRYFLGIEDIDITALRNDRDYNDFGVTFTTPQPVPSQGPCCCSGRASQRSRPGARPPHASRCGTFRLNRGPIQHEARSRGQQLLAPCSCTGQKSRPTSRILPSQTL